MRGFWERTAKYLEAQRLSAKFKVLVGGAGTIGTRLILNLVKYDFKEIIVVDYDRVAPENIGYQEIFTKEDLGKPKAKVVEKLNDSHPWTKVTGVDWEVPTPSSIASWEDWERLDSLIKEVDIVITSFDSVQPRASMMIFSIKNGKKYVDVGLGPSRGYVKVYKRNFCPICKVYGERVAYYTNPALASAVASLGAQAVLYSLNERYWPSLITINLDSPPNFLWAGDVASKCKLCEVKGLTIKEMVEYLVKYGYQSTS